MPSLRDHWTLDPEVAYLDHGCYGACPRPVLAAQAELRARMEREPVRFLSRELPALLDRARGELALFLGADPDDLAFVSNATEGVATVLASLPLRDGDELLTTDHAYNACRNALDRIAARTGAKVVVAQVPFPLRRPEEIADAVLSAVTPRSRLALLDHVTSPTALVFPLETLVPALRARGVETLVDGAHAPGQLPLSLGSLGAAYYTGNCHKWLCAPKGAAFLHVRRELQPSIRPLQTSHGANSPRVDRSRFRLEFDWRGTADPTPWLCVPEALRFIEGLRPGGWPAHVAENHSLALRARARLCETLGIAAPCPPELLASMASVPLPAAPGPFDPLAPEPLREALWQRGIDVPVFPWAGGGVALPFGRLLRVSAQAYVEPGDLDRLCAALARLLPSAVFPPPPLL
ncbi:MAG: aminotransferase class V-fold PLP-dependent enzyme [Deltaproteobacteria bacterium]